MSVEFDRKYSAGPRELFPSGQRYYLIKFDNLETDYFDVEWYARQPDGTESRTILVEHTRRR